MRPFAHGGSGGTRGPRPFRHFLVFVACSTVGCAGHSPSFERPAAAPRPRSAALQRLPEKFDPRTLQDDLLLVRPHLSRAQVDARLFPEAPATALAPSDSGGSPAPSLVHPDEVLPAHYQVQVLALSQRRTAEEKRQELQEALNAPVFVVPRGDLFLVRAGVCFSAHEAAALKARIQALSPEYSDAYVVPAAQRAQVPGTPSPARADSAGVSASTSGSGTEPAALTPSRPMVQVFGWRVVLDKMQSYEQAQAFERRAARRLGRSDLEITFEAPWYNIELGQYRTAAAAQQALERLKGRFPNALIVRARILVPAED